MAIPLTILTRVSKYLTAWRNTGSLTPRERERERESNCDLFLTVSIHSKTEVGKDRPLFFLNKMHSK